MRKAPEDPEALHEYRKQARRLWATVQLAELYMTPVQHARAIRAVASLADGLGAVRDRDVLVKRLRALARGKSNPLRDGLRKATEATSGPSRKKRVARAVASAKGKRLAGPLESLLKKFRPGWLDPLALLRHRVHERSRVVTASSSKEALHALRLELKAFRYAVEALGSEAAAPDLAAARQAHKATDVLGRIMDAHALTELAKAQPPRVAKTLLAAARRDDEAARKDLAAAWATKWPDLRALGVA